jgi:hypothetical protein
LKLKTPESEMKLILFFFLLTAYIHPQCSDAGICSLGGHSQEEKQDFRINLSYQYGYSGSTDDISFNTAKVEGEYFYAENSLILLSLPYSGQSGPLGSVSGIGDLLLIASQNIYKNYNTALNIQGGLKLATGNDNAGGLPQAYQSGLGTNDILLGVSLQSYNFYSSAGYQLSGGRNDNIQRVERGDDFLLSAGYNYVLINDLTGGFELLLIKRVGETSIEDPLNPGSFISIPESDNLQINTAVTITYMLTEAAGIKLFGAVPLRKRPVNIDRLTRSLSVAVGAYLAF